LGIWYAHYQPDAELFLTTTIDAVKLADAFPRRRVGVICVRCPVESSGELRVRSMNGVAEYARRLYRTLVDLDDEGCEVIVAELPPRGGIGDALIDRLRRAAGGRTLEG
jgi:L-threonylcarbamoyladenylate synthase